MKVRVGFVSNSSSSSYVILLPENFETGRYSDELADHFFQLTTSGAVWREEIGGDAYSNMLSQLKRYVIAEIESGPDDDRIILADRKKVRAIINED